MPERLPVPSVTEEKVRFDGSAGALAGILTYPDRSSVKGGILVTGPHPLLGGDAENNVVRSVARGLAAAGHLTLRFDYRGVGESEGPLLTSTGNINQFLATSRIALESAYAEDVTAATNFLQTLGERIVAYVGYSFGAWLIVQQSGNHNSSREHLVLIAPTVGQHDYSLLRTCRRSKLIIASTDDFAVSQDELHRQFAQWAEPKKLLLEPMDNHFFRGFEGELVSRIVEDLQQRMHPGQTSVPATDSVIDSVNGKEPGNEPFGKGSDHFSPGEMALQASQSDSAGLYPADDPRPGAGKSAEKRQCH